MRRPLRQRKGARKQGDAAGRGAPRGHLGFAVADTVCPRRSSRDDPRLLSAVSRLRSVRVRVERSNRGSTPISRSPTAARRRRAPAAPSLIGIFTAGKRCRHVNRARRGDAGVSSAPQRRSRVALAARHIELLPPRLLLATSSTCSGVLALPSDRDGAYRRLENQRACRKMLLSKAVLGHMGFMGLL